MVQQLSAEFVCFVGTLETAVIWLWYALENLRHFGQCICYVKRNINFIGSFVVWDRLHFLFLPQGDLRWKDKMRFVENHNEGNWRSYVQGSGSLFCSTWHYFTLFNLKSRSYRKNFFQLKIMVSWRGHRITKVV